jgi:hypothetical protein
VTTIGYTPNATVRSVPAALNLSLTGLKAGAHRLTVVITYKRAGRKATASLTKTLRVTFSIC